MNAIQRRNFDDAKKNINLFSNDVPQFIDLDTVATDGGLFNWFSHKVEGAELNNLTAQIQQYLISITNYQNRTIKEFGEIYKAFEALDKDYITWIIAAVKSAEKASEEAKKSASKAETNSNDIKIIIDAQKRTINALEQFRDKIEKYEHLKNIDEIWGNYKKTETEIKAISDSIKTISNKTSQTQNSVNELKINVEQQWEKARLMFEDYERSLNNQITEVRDRIKTVNSIFEKQLAQIIENNDEFKNVFNQNIVQVDSKINEFTTSVNQKIEQMNSSVEEISVLKKQVAQSNDGINNLKDIFNQCSIEMNDKISGIDDAVEKQAKQVAEYDARLNEITLNHEKQIKHLLKQIKFTYILAGGAIGITLISVLLTVLGVL